MDSFFVSLNAVMPLVIMACIGYFIRWKRWLSEKSFNEVNRLCFKLFLPALLFYNSYMSATAIGEHAKVVLYGVVSIMILFVIVSFLVPFFVKKTERRGVMIQGITRGNFVLLGIPVATVICGEGNIGSAAIAAAFVVPLINFLSVVTLTAHSSEKKDLKQIFYNVIKNPLILSSFAGLAMMLLNIQLPTFLLSTIRDIGKVATPLSVIVLGGSLAIEQTVKNKTALIWSCIGKLIIMPLATIPLAIFLGFTGTSLVTIMVIFAAPTAINSFIMAQQMGGDGELAGEIVICTTIGSAFTMFIWIFVLSYLGFI